MICPKCNKEIEDGLYRCPLCNEKVFFSKVPKKYPEDEEEEVVDDGLRPMESQTTRQFFKTIIIVGITCIGILVFILVGSLIAHLLNL